MDFAHRLCLRLCGAVRRLSLDGRVAANIIKYAVRLPSTEETRILSNVFDSKRQSKRKEFTERVLACWCEQMCGCNRANAWVNLVGSADVAGGLSTKRVTD